MKVPGDVDHDDSLVSLDQQNKFQQIRALIVEQVFIPVLYDEFRHEDRNLSVAYLLLFGKNMLYQRLRERSIR